MINVTKFSNNRSNHKGFLFYKLITTFLHHLRACDTGEAGGAMAPLYFCVAKRTKGGNGKKERVSKQKLSKGCHQGQSIIVLTILERLEFEYFSYWPTMDGGIS